MKFKLQQLRSQAGYKNRDKFAEAIGVKPSTYKSWETGRTRLKFDDACLIADFLGITLDEIAGRTEYICKYSDHRQEQINADFETLDNASKDAAVAAVRGLALACTQKNADGGKSPEILSA